MTAEGAELCCSPMVATCACPSMEDRGREREKEDLERGRGHWRWGGMSPICSWHQRGREQGGGGSNGDLELVLGNHVHNTCCPLGHFIKHVAGKDVFSVGSDLCQL